jgi:hypothetical protein
VIATGSRDGKIVVSKTPMLPKRADAEDNVVNYKERRKTHISEESEGWRDEVRRKKEMLIAASGDTAGKVRWHCQLYPTKRPFHSVAGVYGIHLTYGLFIPGQRNHNLVWGCARATSQGSVCWEASFRAPNAGSRWNPDCARKAEAAWRSHCIYGPTKGSARHTRDRDLVHRAAVILWA